MRGSFFGLFRLFRGRENHENADEGISDFPVFHFPVFPLFSPTALPSAKATAASSLTR